MRRRVGMRILAVLLTLVMLFGVMPTSVLAEQDAGGKTAATVPADDETRQTESDAAEPQSPTLEGDDPTPADEEPAGEEEPPELGYGTLQRSVSGPTRAGSDVNLTVKFLRGAKEIGDDLVWTPTSYDSGHRFDFQVSWTASGEGEYQPGEIEVRVPKSILLDRNGNPADQFEIRVPLDTSEGLTSGNIWVYRVEGDEIVVYNRVVTDGATATYFDIGYATSESTYKYADYKSTTSANPNPRAGSNPFRAKLTVTRNGQETALERGDIPVYIDTTAKVNYVTKSASNFHETWNSSWGTAPADAADYYYISWVIKADVSATQPYTLRYEDAFDHAGGSIVGYSKGYSWAPLRPWGNNITTEEQKTDYVSDIYVVTRHPKEPHDAAVEGGATYTVRNTATVTLTPADGVDSATADSDQGVKYFAAPSYEKPTGHFYETKYAYTGTWGYGPNYWSQVTSSENVSSWRLSDFASSADNKIDKISGLLYYADVYGYPYPWTVPEGAELHGDERDVPLYGQRPVTYVLTDNDFRLKTITGEFGQQLTGDDYQIDALQLAVRMNDARYDEAQRKFVSTAVTYTDEDVIHIYGEFNGAYVPVANYDLKNNRFTDVDDTYVASTAADTLIVTFREGAVCTGFKLETANAHYYTKMGAYLTVTLKASDTVQPVADAAAAEQDAKLVLKNTMNSALYMDNGSLIRGGTKDNSCYIAGAVRTGSISKSIRSRNYDTVTNRYTVNWEVSVREELRSGGHVTQGSGVFYDLLPRDMSLQRDSVRIEVKYNTYLQTGEYQVSTVENYKNSGRTLLIVRMNAPGQYYYLYYATVVDGETLAAYPAGLEAENRVAYETGNADIGDGRPDDGGGLWDDDYMVDLDPDTDARRFLYAKAATTIDELSYASMGLSKKVRAEKEAVYGEDSLTEIDGQYAYRLRFAPDAVTSAEGLILFDSLENHVVEGGDEDGRSSDWHGVLTGVDVSQARSLGIAPVVYYATRANLDIRQYGVPAAGGALPDVWVRAEEYTGTLDQVKAIAVDLRTGADGRPFALPVNTALYVTVHMRAPHAVPERYENGQLVYPVAYNGVFLYGTFKNTESNTTQTTLIHQEYTRITLRALADLSLKKVDSSAPEKAISGVKFRLWGTSDYGTAVDRTETTPSSGRILFEGLERGTYYLQEVESPPEYHLRPAVHTVVVDNEGRLSLDGLAPDTRNTVFLEKITLDDSGLYTVANDPREFADVIFFKMGAASLTTPESPLAGVVFKLAGTSDYGNEIVAYATSESNGGRVVFENIEIGTYTLTEVSTVEGYYRLLTDALTVRVDGRERVPNSYYDYYINRFTITGGSEGVVLSEENPNNSYYSNINFYTRYTIYNQPYHLIKLVKRDATNPSVYLEGAVFRLSGTSDSGAPYDQTVTSNASGVLEFTMLEPGTYTLEEVEAPSRYQRDETRRTVTVAEDGSATIEGLTPLGEEDETFAGAFPVTNARKLEGVVEITKVWQGGAPTDGAFPVIHIETEEEGTNLPYVTILDLPPAFKENGVSFRRSPGMTQARIDQMMMNGDHDIEIVTDPANSTAGYDVYMWMDEGGNVFWWANTPIVYLPVNAEHLFSRGMWIPIYCDERADPTAFTFRYGFDEASAAFGWRCEHPNPAKFTTVDLRGLRSDKTTTMRGWFNGAVELTTLIGLERLNTANVTDMRGLFTGVRSTLDVSNFNTAKVTDMAGMFAFTGPHNKLDVSGFDTANVTDMAAMFYGFDTFFIPPADDSVPPEFPYLDLSGFDTAKVTSMNSMFANARFDQLRPGLDLSSFDTSNVTDMYAMFARVALPIDPDTVILSDDGELTYFEFVPLDFSGFRTGKVTNMAYMFNEFRGDTLDLSSFDTGNVVFMDHMFDQAEYLVNLNVSSFNTEKVRYMEYMFRRSALSRMVPSESHVLDLSSFNVTNMEYARDMFHHSGWNVIDISGPGWDKRMGGWQRNGNMFGECYFLETIYADCNPWVLHGNNMFGGYSYNPEWEWPLLTGGNGTKMQVKPNGYVDTYSDSYARIDGDGGYPGFFTRKENSDPAPNPSVQNAPAPMDGSRAAARGIKPALARRGTEPEVNNDGDRITLFYTSNSEMSATGGEDVFDCWIDNGDGTWTYRFRVFDQDATYTLWESELEGYESDTTVDNPAQIVYKQGQKATGTVTNKKNHVPDYTEHYSYDGELPKDVMDTLPTRADRYPDGATVIPADPSDKEIPAEGGKWVFKGWDQNKAVVDGADVYFVGTWEFVKDEEPPVEVDYTEHYSYDGELPKDVLDTLPTRADRYKDGTTVIPADPSHKEIPAEGGKWVFKGWDQDKAVVDGADVYFVGTWEFVKDEEPPVEVDYTEHYSYDGELPKEVLDTLPTRADRYKDGTTVIPADPSHKEIPAEGGKWVFKGWDQNKAVVDGADVYFVGTWELVKDEEPPVEVDYTEHYSYDGELPKEVLDTLPTRADRYPDGTTVIPADPSHKEIPAEGGKWVFKGWDQEKAVVDGDDVYFVGTWEFLADPATPRTGDNSMTGLWLTLMCASLTALAGVVFFGKKKAYQGKRVK